MEKVMAMFHLALKGFSGKRLTYRTTHSAVEA
jgi:hypothetical protein